jgi:glycosyltransferase involved in cell wall biosynthesis
LRVLLFDHATAGHHLEYAGHIARYLGNEGDDVLFATWARPLSPIVPSVEEVVGKVAYLADEGSVSRLARAAGWPLVEAQGVHRCLRLATQEGVDVVHFLCLDRSELAMLASLSLRTRRPALFGTLMKPYFVHDAHETVSAGRRLFHGASQRALSRMLRKGMMDGLFVHSERTKSLLSARFSEPSLARRISVVPDPAKEAPAISMEEARAALGLPGRIPVILFFGDARYDKGPDMLLQALRRLRGDWVAVLAGAPVDVGEEDAEACRGVLQFPDRLLTRFGYIAEADADRFFRAADVIVLPYRTSFKGTSGVLRRAAASGKPVIASDVGDVGPDVMEAGLGRVIPAESVEHLAMALQDFLGRREQLTRDVEPRALEYARANDWRVLGRATRAKYLSVLGTGPCSGPRPGTAEQTQP